MPNDADEFWSEIRTRMWPLRCARLKQRAPKRHRMRSISPAGKRVVPESLFFQDSPENGKLVRETP
jgi:hypothetical protein